jgi:hypothetical protein
MPDGPRYDDDFYAWTQYQAKVLRTLRTRDNRFDRDNVAEEIETVGRNERDAVRSEVRRILEHFLKLEHSPATEPRSDWMVAIANARAELEEKLTATLRQDVETVLPRVYARAKDVGEVALLKYGEGNAVTRFPATCPYTLDQILAIGWYPEPAEERK